MTAVARAYPAVLEHDSDGRVLVSFPDFPEAHTYGDDEEEALLQARDALATIIDAYIRDRQPIPEPSRTRRGWQDVRLPALTAAKVDLYTSMRDAGVTKSALARRLGWHLPQVDRLLDVHHASRLDQLEAAFGVLGKELLVGTHRVAYWRVGARSGAATGIGAKPSVLVDRRRRGNREFIETSTAKMLHRRSRKKKPRRR